MPHEAADFLHGLSATKASRRKASMALNVMQRHYRPSLKVCNRAFDVSSQARSSSGFVSLVNNQGCRAPVAAGEFSSHSHRVTNTGQSLDDPLDYVEVATPVRLNSLGEASYQCSPHEG